MRTSAQRPCHGKRNGLRTVILGVQLRRTFCQLLRELRATALGSEAHQATLHDRVRHKALLKDLRIKVAGTIVEAAIGIHLRHRTVNRNSHAVLRAAILKDLLGKAQRLRVGAAREDADQVALAEFAAAGGLLALHVVRTGIAIRNKKLEQRVNSDGGNRTAIGVAD